MKLENAKALDMDQMDKVAGGTTDEIIDLYNACVDKLGIGAMGSVAKFIVGNAKYLPGPGSYFAYSAAGAVMDPLLSKVLGIKVVTHAGDKGNTYLQTSYTSSGNEMMDKFYGALGGKPIGHSQVLSMIKNLNV